MQKDSAAQGASASLQPSHMHNAEPIHSCPLPCTALLACKASPPASPVASWEGDTALHMSQTPLSLGFLTSIYLRQATTWGSIYKLLQIRPLAWNPQIKAGKQVPFRTTVDAEHRAGDVSGVVLTAAPHGVGIGQLREPWLAEVAAVALHVLLADTVPCERVADGARHGAIRVALAGWKHTGNSSAEGRTRGPGKVLGGAPGTHADRLQDGRDPAAGCGNSGVCSAHSCCPQCCAGSCHRRRRSPRRWRGTARGRSGTKSSAHCSCTLKIQPKRSLQCCNPRQRQLRH